MKITAVVALGGVLTLGAALVSKSESPAGSPSPMAGNPANNTANFAVISHGEAVNLVDHAGEGDQYTIFLFGADW